jgi:hypothetical protein
MLLHVPVCALQIQAIQSNLNLMAMWFLGTCSAAAPSSSHGPSLSLRAGNSIWFFDCADDTQRQLQRVSTGVCLASQILVPNLVNLILRSANVVPSSNPPTPKPEASAYIRN